MPWRFGDSTDEGWIAHRRNRLDRIDTWWETFAGKTEQLDALFQGEERWDLGAFMADHLGPVDERLMWEYGPGLEGGHRLVITPESEFALRPFVHTLIERAPELDGWEFYEYRLSEGVEEATHRVRAQGLPPLEGARVVAVPGELHLVDLTFVVDDAGGAERDELAHSAFVATEVLLGERVLDEWIGSIDVREAESETEGAVALSDLKRKVDSILGRLRQQLPERPLHEFIDEESGRTSWTLKPRDLEAYPEQLDLITAQSATPEIWTATHSGVSFSSARFSRHGELFAYLKFAGPVAEDGMTFERRIVLEEELDEALQEEGLGVTTGGGTGTVYTYVELALTRPEEAVERIRTFLRSSDVPVQGWLLFHDATLADEWVGTRPETPPPPR